MIWNFVTFIAVAFIMMSASVQDLRRREVSDIHWIAIGVIGTIISLASEDLAGGIMRAAGCSLMLLSLFTERIKPLIAFPAITVLMLASYIVSSDPSGIVTAATSFVAMVLYSTGAIRGGADTKALIAISMVYPLYPDLGSMIWSPTYPAGYILNPVFSILFEGLLFSILLMVPVLVRNLKEGRFSLSSYHIGIDRAREAFVWPLEDVREGNVVRIRPTDDPDIYGRLEEIGRREVLVTPMIPFILPMTAAFICTMILGCPLFAFI